MNFYASFVGLNDYKLIGGGKEEANDCWNTLRAVMPEGIAERTKKSVDTGIDHATHEDKEWQKQFDECLNLLNPQTEEDEEDEEDLRERIAELEKHVVFLENFIKKNLPGRNPYE